jgi:hypothetical protein
VWSQRPLTSRALKFVSSYTSPHFTYPIVITMNSLFRSSGAHASLLPSEPSTSRSSVSRISSLHQAHQNQSQARGSIRAFVLTPARLSNSAEVKENIRSDVMKESRIEELSSTVTRGGESPEALLAQVLSPVAVDMEEMRKNLKNVVGQRHPMLMAAAEQIFSAGEWLRAYLALWLPLLQPLSSRFD